MSLPESYEAKEPFNSPELEDWKHDETVRMTLAVSAFNEIARMADWMNEFDLSYHARNTYQLADASLRIDKAVQETMQMLGYCLDDPIHMSYKDAAEMVIRYGIIDNRL